MKSYAKIAIGGVVLMLAAAPSAMASCYQQDEFHYDENGVRNILDYTVNGDGIYVSADQHGALNRVTGVLNGCGHAGITYQEGFGNHLDVYVGGRGNSYGVLQSGGGAVHLDINGRGTAVGIRQENNSIIKIRSDGVGGTVRVHTRRY